jgi:hypothetical protein
MALTSKKISYRAIGDISSNTGGINRNLVFSAQIEPNTYTGVRVILFNTFTDPVINAKASMSWVVDKAFPLTPNATPDLFLFSGSSTVTIPANSTGNPERHSFVMSDLLAITPTARIDSGRGFIAHARMFAPSAGNTQGARATSLNSNSTTFDQGVGQVIGSAGGGDLTESTTAIAQSTIGPPMMLVFTADNGAVSFCGIGDSITQGLDGVNDLTGAIRYAADTISLTGTRTALSNFGYSGAVTDTYLANFEDSLAFTVPTVALFSPWSPNNTNAFAAAGIGEAETATSDFVALARANGFAPIVATTTPVNGRSSTLNDARLDIDAAIQARIALLTTASQPVYEHDRNTIFSDPSPTPDIWFLAALSDDGTHPNQTGYELEAVSLSALLVTINLANTSHTGRISIDYGKVVDATGAPWNDFTDVGATAALNDLIDNNSNPTGVDTSSQNLGTWTAESKSITTAVEGCSSWPGSVVDSTFRSFSTQEQRFDFSGGDPLFIGAEVVFHIWGGETVDDDDRDGIFTLNTSGGAELATGTHDARDDGIAPPLVLTVTVPSDGILDLFCAPESSRVFISGIEMCYSISLPSGGSVSEFISGFINSEGTVSTFIN